MFPLVFLKTPLSLSDYRTPQKFIKYSNTLLFQHIHLIFSFIFFQLSKTFLSTQFHKQSFSFSQTQKQTQNSYKNERRGKEHEVPSLCCYFHSVSNHSDHDLRTHRDESKGSQSEVPNCDRPKFQLRQHEQSVFQHGFGDQICCEEHELRSIQVLQQYCHNLVRWPSNRVC